MGLGCPDVNNMCNVPQLLTGVASPFGLEALTQS
jgi:hypothetical protein